MNGGFIQVCIELTDLQTLELLQWKIENSTLLKVEDKSYDFYLLLIF